MNKLVIFLIPILIFSCNNSEKNKEVMQKEVKDNEVEVVEQVALETLVTSAEVEDNVRLEHPTIEEANDENEDDCIFDQATQTDEFLHGISELENYSWDAEQKVATIPLNTSDTLLIRRGGCYHFGVSAEFILYRRSIDYSKWENVFERVLWISKLLESEFAYEDIKEEIENSKIRIEEDNVSFQSEYLGDNNYSLYRKIEEGKTVIELSYYIN